MLTRFNLALPHLLFHLFHLFLIIFSPLHQRREGGRCRMVAELQFTLPISFDGFLGAACSLAWRFRCCCDLPRYTYLESYAFSLFFFSFFISFLSLDDGIDWLAMDYCIWSFMAIARRFIDLGPFMFDLAYTFITLILNSALFFLQVELP